MNEPSGDGQPPPPSCGDIQQRVDSLVAELHSLVPLATKNQRAQISAALQSAIPKSIDTTAHSFLPGHRTTLTGLVRRSELNGVVITLTRWVAESGRWAVCCDNGEALSVHPHNLVSQALLPELVMTVLQTAELPYAEGVLSYLWPNILEFAGTCQAMRNIGLAVARRSVQGIVGAEEPAAAWRALKAYARARVVLVGGYSTHSYASEAGRARPYQHEGRSGLRSFNLRSCFVGEGEPHRWPTTKAVLAVPFREEFSVAVCDGSLYISNGCDQHIYPERSSWSHHYLADGDEAEELATMLRYDFAQGDWSTCRVPAPPPGFECTTAGSLGALGGRLIYTGGTCEVEEYDDDDDLDAPEQDALLLNTAHIYDQATDSWTAIAPMSRPRHYHASCDFAGKLYVTGGDVEAPFSVERYDPELGVWQPVADLVPYGFAVPLGRRSVGYDCVHLICCADSLYFVRVEQISRAERRRVRAEVTLQEYSEAEDTWVSVDVVARQTDLSKISLRTPVVAAGGKIILFGSEPANAEPSMLTIEVDGPRRGTMVSRGYGPAESLTWAVGAVVPPVPFPEAARI